MQRTLIEVADNHLQGVTLVEALGDFHHCCAVRVTDSQNQHWIIKSIEPAYLASIAGFDERHHVATVIARQMREYYEVLSIAGLTVPHDYHVKVIAELENGVSVVEVATYSGPDLVRLLTDEPERSSEIVEEVLGTLLPVIYKDELGLDPHPSNFAKNGGLTFIDFFPARYGGIVGFPQPLESEMINHATLRYYSPFGKLRILRFNLRRISPDLQDIFHTQLGSFYPEAPDLFQELPVERAKELLARGKHSLIADQIQGLGLMQIDDLREIAVEVVPDRTELTRLFELTQIDFRRTIIEREARLSQFKHQLTHILTTF